jgi:hypothetical protein
MGEPYTFNTQNCQLFFNVLFECIRTSTTVNDVFENLFGIPDNQVVRVVDQRLQGLGAAYCSKIHKFETVQPIPTLFGTIYVTTLVAATAAMLTYLWIYVGVTVALTVGTIVTVWSPLAQGHMTIYRPRYMTDVDRKRLRWLYSIKYENSEKVIAIEGLQTISPEQHGRIMEIDEQEEEVLMSEMDDAKARKCFFGLPKEVHRLAILTRTHVNGDRYISE